jgi:hypothetical protein
MGVWLLVIVLKEGKQTSGLSMIGAIVFHFGVRRGSPALLLVVVVLGLVVWWRLWWPCAGSFVVWQWPSCHFTVEVFSKLLFLGCCHSIVLSTLLVAAEMHLTYSIQAEQKDTCMAQIMMDNRTQFV